jgi:hypothetical protein
LSGYAVDRIRDREPDKTVLSGNWSGVIAVGADDMADRVHVTIPDFDPQLRIGPCRWQSRDDTSHPARGDWCLIAFDQRGEATVISWWPFA